LEVAAQKKAKMKVELIIQSLDKSQEIQKAHDG